MQIKHGDIVPAERKFVYKEIKSFQLFDDVCIAAAHGINRLGVFQLVRFAFDKQCALNQIQGFLHAHQTLLYQSGWCWSATRNA